MSCANMLHELIEKYNLSDVWRAVNPEEKNFTRRAMTKSNMVSSRLDFWLMSMHMIFNLKKVSIEPGYKSDHSLISVSFNAQNTHQRGRGFWKFNNSLLREPDYMERIKQTLHDCQLKYSDLQNKSLKWDTIKCEIRATTISYAAFRSKQKKATIENLLRNLKQLEQDLDNGLDVHDAYNDSVQSKTYRRW